MKLFCDYKTDEEKSNFFLSGRAVETGVIAPAISNEVAMAYHRCAQLKKENDDLRAKIEAIDAAVEMIERMERVLRLIAETDPIDAALDPQRAIRIARTALEKSK